MSLIRAEDIAAVRDRARIEDIVGEHVTLRRAGTGSLKGLCPFHDERTPSFQVRPQLGRWHCFGCALGGDVFDFLVRIDHLSFTEAVQKLADRYGVQLRLEEGGAARQQEAGQRRRLLEAHRVAADFYAEQLASSPAAAPGRAFLAERGFDQAAAGTFGVGFAPRDGDVLWRHLRGKGFADGDLVTAGLTGVSGRGPYDRFRGRLVWPIRDITGDVVGFGARRLLDDDPIAAKYLNTAETPIYRKSQVLYGVDLAKRDIAKRRQAVVVEGYTDVMACHLAGVPTAVATCGTAFGADHIKVVRRLLMDDATFNGEIVFTFDGDEAGRQAALRAFAEDQRFVAQTFVAVEPTGQDPCELRQARGDEAVRQLVAHRVPLFEFAIRATLRSRDLDTAEGRVQGLRAAAPVVAAIRDRSLRPEYGRQLAGWLGMEVEPVLAAVRQAERAGRTAPAPEVSSPAEPDGPPRPDPRDPVIAVEREALKLVLQAPQQVPAGELGGTLFSAPAHRAVHEAIERARAVHGGSPPGGAVEQAASAASVRTLISELLVEPLHGVGEEPDARYANALLARLGELAVGRQVAELRSRLQRLDPDDPGYQPAFAELVSAEQRRRALREVAAG